ncbi:hypothetical protein ACIQGW_05105 [Lysinibacillus xylanilyticus]|uniref:hypothetical protein n=1 Tax=Lysinibacillus xylanilyticus TaxID=582475 RepID=UPI003829517A
MKEIKQSVGMNQEQLNAIKKRITKASVGPWVVDSKNYPDHKRAKLVTNSHLYIAKTFAKENDADFIAFAREDVPALLAEVERLHEELAQSNVKQMGLVLEIADQKLQKREYIKTLHLVNEENKRLREALEFYADPVTYEPISAYINGEKTECYPIDGDEGENARKALGDSE